MVIKGRMIQPNLDRTDPVKLAASTWVIQYLSDTNSDVWWTVRKYTLTTDCVWPPTQWRLLPTQTTHSISSSHLQLESLSRCVIVVQRCSVIEHWLCTGWRLSCMPALPPLMLLLSVHALPVVNALTRSLKSTACSRAVWLLTIKIEFDPAIDSIWIQSIKIGFGFDSNSVLEPVRTLMVILCQWCKHVPV